MTRNLLLTLMYDGSRYHGWQVQENALTVQECLQDAIETVFGERLPVTGCSRTDAGVHANMFCCNFHTVKLLACERVAAALNARLGEDIAVTHCREVPEDFHARYSCVSKQYKYLIWNGQARNPFYYKRAFHYKYPLDAKLLDAAAKGFIGSYDFSAFCAAGSDVESKTRTVKAASVSRHGDMVEFAVLADGFLYNMVRIMAGTLIYVAEGKIAKDAVIDIILSKERGRAGFTAPAHGLYLNRVNYDLGGAED